jgi:hypothetical protein
MPRIPVRLETKVVQPKQTFPDRCEPHFGDRALVPVSVCVCVSNDVLRLRLVRGNFDMAQADQCFWLELHVEQVEDEASNGRLIVVCGDDTEGTVEERDG